MLLFSVYLLHPFLSVFWKRCSLSKFLGSTFKNSVFTPKVLSFQSLLVGRLLLLDWRLREKALNSDMRVVGGHPGSVLVEVNQAINTWLFMLYMTKSEKIIHKG